jgi:hypothetical protein
MEVFMNLMQLTAEVNQILEEMYFDPTRTSYRLRVCVDNNAIIRELKEQVADMTFFSWSVIGVVGGKKYFIVHNRMPADSTYGEGWVRGGGSAPVGEVIVVDFKAKKVLSRQAA